MRYCAGSIHDSVRWRVMCSTDQENTTGDEKKTAVFPHEKCSLSMGEVFCLDVMRYCHAVAQCRTSRATPMQPVPFYNVLALDQFPLSSIALKPIIN